MSAPEVPPWHDVATLRHEARFRDDAGAWWKVVRLGVRIRDVYASADGVEWHYRGRVRAQSDEPQRLRAAIARAGLEAA